MVFPNEEKVRVTSKEEEKHQLKRELEELRQSSAV
jgi:hypothetical protein